MCSLVILSKSIVSIFISDYSSHKYIFTIFKYINGITVTYHVKFAYRTPKMKMKLPKDITLVYEPSVLGGFYLDNVL